MYDNNVSYMKTEKVKKLIKEAGGKWTNFLDFMFGGQYKIGKDGKPDWYEIDVDRFIRNVKRK